MLSLRMIEKIEWLLRASELSQRQIASRLGVSRGTVAAIAHGKRSTTRQRTTPALRRTLHGQGAPQVVPDVDAEPIRCPGCGYRVYLPCLVCHVRALKRAQRAVRRCRRGIYVKRLTPAGGDHGSSIENLSQGKTIGGGQVRGFG